MGRALTILFVLPYPGYLRLFESVVRLLAARGHDVLLSYEAPDKRGQVALVPAGCAARAVEPMPRFDESGARRWLFAAAALADYVRFMAPAYRGRGYLRERMQKYLPRPWRFLTRVAILPAWVTRGVASVARTLEHLVPAPRATREYLTRLSPDVVVVSPLVLRGAGGVRQAQVVKAADALGVPTVLAVGSWDHLSSKGLVRVEPTAVVLWNNHQKREAIDLHQVPAARVTVTGAQSLDFWFDARPALQEEAFLAAAGLPPGPFLVYVGSTRGIVSNEDELGFVRRWITALRGSAHECLRGLGVIVRPHPGNAGHWLGADLGERVAVFPRRAPAFPMDDGERQDYLHTLHWSRGVVGINTSAMVEAAIVGRPVFTVELPELRRAQRETDHFRYLLPEAGGAVLTAASFEAHLEQVLAALQSPGRARAAASEFVTSFVRPFGLDTPATPRVADAIEAAARG